MTKTATSISARRCRCSCSTTTTLAYHERTAGQHYRNLQDGSPLVIAVANLAEKKGYRFRGTVTLHTDDDIYDAQVKVAEEGHQEARRHPGCWITGIQDLSSGATAGKTI